MPYARAIARKLDHYPFYEWVEPLQKWEDDEFEDEKHGTIRERAAAACKDKVDVRRGKLR
jgi:hypothetical protein